MLSCCSLQLSVIAFTMTIMSLSFRFLLLALLAINVESFFTSVEEKEIDVIPNPYDHSDAVKSCPTRLDWLLEPYNLITKPLTTQADTFQGLSYAKVLTVPVPVYSMKQPARISASELQFQLVLVNQVSMAAATNLHEIPVDPEAAKDSWFPGYSWAPLVMSCGGGGDSDEIASGYQHVGWKFTALSSDSAMPSFYALMVQFEEKNEITEGIRLGGFKAPGWMVMGIIS
jgi:hypothetical protein